MRRRWLVPGLALGLILGLIGCAEESTRMIDERDTPADTAASLPPLEGADLFSIACAGCHRIESGGAHDVGPNLYGMAAQAAASRPGYAYSDALKATDLVWDRGSLAAWIAATETLVPGTSMSYANILNGDEVARVVDYLLHRAPADGDQRQQGEPDED